jgi:hypothetical protein
MGRGFYKIFQSRPTSVVHFAERVLSLLRENRRAASSNVIHPFSPTERFVNDTASALSLEAES